MRDTASPKTKELESLPKGNSSRLIIEKIIVDESHSAAQAISNLQAQHQISHIDIAIANAGICDHWGPVLEASEEDVLSHFEINTLGPLRLFKAVAPLLKKAKTPKFIYISTLLASIGFIGKMEIVQNPGRRILDWDCGIVQDGLRLGICHPAHCTDLRTVKTANSRLHVGRAKNSPDRCTHAGSYKDVEE